MLQIKDWRRWADSVGSIAHFVQKYRVGIFFMFVGAAIGIIGGAFGKTVAVVLGVICFAIGIGVLIWKPKEKTAHDQEKIKQSEPLPLKQRTIDLANDLFELLRKQGPQPPRPLSVKGSEEEQRRAFDAYFGWIKDTYFKYMAHFRDRVVKIDYELAAEGIFTKLEPREIDPPTTTNEVDVKKIAEALMLTGSHMPDVQEKSTSVIR